MSTKKFRIHIKADTDEELKEHLKEFAFVLTGLMEATKKWEINYGALNRYEKEKWQKRAQELIDKHKVYYK